MPQATEDQASDRPRWRQALGRLRRDFTTLDPSKLMVAPILFLVVLALLDRAIYEVERRADPTMRERSTRL